MQPKTSFDSLYAAFVALIEVVTGRPCWRKGSMQAQPKSAYSTIYFSEGGSYVQDVVEEIANTDGNGEPYYQQTWGATKLECKAEFYRNDSHGTALDAAIRFRNSLQFESRFDDVWNICGLIGDIRLIDLTSVFRADIESRVDIRFGLYANIADPQPLTGTGIYDINSTQINVHRDTVQTDPIVISFSFSNTMDGSWEAARPDPFNAGTFSSPTSDSYDAGSFENTGTLDVDFILDESTLR